MRRLSFAALLAGSWGQSVATTRAGNELILAQCSGGDQVQHWSVTVSGQVMHTATTLLVSAWTAGHSGWTASVYLIAGTPPITPWASWSLPPQGAPAAVTNSAIPIEGCWQWAIEGGAAVEGARVTLEKCSSASLLFEHSNPSFGPYSLSVQNADGSATGLCVVPDSALSGVVKLDDNAGANLGPPWAGTGAIIGEGSSRLLFDYPAAQQSAILDLLFLPGYGACLDILKLEVGGDGQAELGTTPSHQHSQGDTPVFTRGMQGWLAQQARARNPNIVLYAIPWSFPGWLRSTPGSLSPYADCPPESGGVCLAAQYMTTWVLGMQATYAIDINVVGALSDYWDGSTADYIKALRRSLDAADLDVRIECADSSSGWPCGDAALADPELAAAVGIFGGHSPPSVDYSNMDRPLWWTHVSSNGEPANLLGAAVMGAQLAKAAASKLSAVIVWGAVCSVPSGTPGHNNGLIRADQPTSGAYYITPSFWSVAHTSQFVRPGWQPMTGVLARGGTWTAWLDAATNNWALVITKFAVGSSANGAIRPEYATFQLVGAFSCSMQPVAHVTTNYGASSSGNVSLFVNTTIIVLGESISLWVGLNTHITIALNVSAFSRPVLAQPPLPLPFPATYADPLTTRGTPGAPAAYLVDVNGALESVNHPLAKHGIQQSVMSAPVTRFNTDTQPHSIIGDQQWTDVDVSVEAFLPAKTDGALLGARCSGLYDTSNSGVAGMDAMQGVWLTVNESMWAMQNRLGPGAVLLGVGSHRIPLSQAEWHAIRLVVRARTAVATVDGHIVARLTLGPVASRGGTPSAGFVSLGSGAFGQAPIFRKLSISASSTSCSVAPTVGAMLYQEACGAGTPGQRWSLLLSAGAPTQLRSTFAANLCIQTDDAAGPDYRWPRSRKVVLAVCDNTERRQKFLVESSSVDTEGAGDMGPIEGPDGLVLAAYGDSDASDTVIITFPYQGGSNALWRYDAVSGLIQDPFSGTCLTACEPLRPM
jgi:galactosylceramidase